MDMRYDADNQCIHRTFNYTKPYEMYLDNAMEEHYKYEDIVYRGVIGLLGCGLILTFLCVIFVLILNVDLPHLIASIIVIFGLLLCILALISFLSGMALFTHWGHTTIGKQIDIMSRNIAEVDQSGSYYIYSQACELPVNQWACDGLIFLWSFYLGWVAVFVHLIALVFLFQVTLILRHSKNRYEI